MAVQQHAPRRRSSASFASGLLVLGCSGWGTRACRWPSRSPRPASTSPGSTSTRPGSTPSTPAPARSRTSRMRRSAICWQRKLLRASTDLDLLAEIDVVLIAVPTPLKDDRQPDLRYVEAATRDIAARLHPGMLVILQSTCSPGHHPRGDAAGPGSRPAWKSARTTSWSSRRSGSTLATPASTSATPRS